LILKRNKEIRAKIVRLVGKDNEQIGVMSLSKALKKAQELELDLVQVSYNTEPYVCKIMDYGKHVFEQQKKQKSKQKVSELHEIQIKPNIAENDLQVKLRKVKEFLNDGDKVKVTVIYKGRELNHFDKGWELLKRITKDLEGLFVIEKQPVMEGSRMFTMLAPNKKKVVDKVSN
jgi:translation initiation factor IF-3